MDDKKILEKLIEHDKHFKKIDERLKVMLTKDDAKQFITKNDAKQFATKDDLKQFATKEDMDDLRDVLLEALDYQVGSMKSHDQEIVALTYASSRHQDTLDHHERDIKRVKTALKIFD